MMISPFGTDGGQLFDAAAEAGADTGGHNHQCRFFIVFLLKLNTPALGCGSKLISGHGHGVLNKARPGQIDDQRGEQQYDAKVEQRRPDAGAALLQQGIGAGVALGVFAVDLSIFS